MRARRTQCGVTRSNPTSHAPISIRSLLMSDAADGPGTPALPGGCTGLASSRSSGSVCRAASCSLIHVYHRRGQISESCSDTTRPVTTFESRIRTVSVAVSPERSSMAWHCLDIERESRCPMMVQLIAYESSSDDHLRRSQLRSVSCHDTIRVPFEGRRTWSASKSARRQDDRANDAGECATAGDNVFHG